MVSSGVLALLVAVAVQTAQAHFVPSGPGVVCGCVAPPKPQYEEGCCPGPVIEKKYVTHKSVTVPYTYSVPTYSKRCHTQPAGVDRKVIPSAYETAPVCETHQTIVKVPTTDVEVQQQPLCKRTCTTSEYLIQIPIVETTCTNTPLCKKTVKTQENVLTTTARKTACAKQICHQNKIIETPLIQTVCQDYQGSIQKVGAKTVLKPEIKKTCVQLPPYRCLKPVSNEAVSVTPYPGTSYAGAASAASAYANAAASAAATAQADASAAYNTYSAGYPASVVSAEADAAAAASASAQADASAASFYASGPSYGPAYASYPSSSSSCSCNCS